MPIFTVRVEIEAKQEWDYTFEADSLEEAEANWTLHDGILIEEFVGDSEIVFVRKEAGSAD